tara:strand:+ start:178 stop:1077 length:900 start_codon:yes stop_codon:yes gene_type:complete
MASTWTLNNAVEKIADGEKTDTWGQITNRNFDILDRAASGVGTIDLSSSAAAHTLNTANGSTGDALSDGMYKVLVLSGATQTCTITVTPNDASKFYLVDNDSGFDATFTQGTGASLSIPNGTSGIIFCDGSGAAANVKAIIDATTLTTLGITATAAELNYSDITTLGTSEASKVVTADANGVVTFDNGITEEFTAVTSSGNATTVNSRDGTVFSHTLTENTTFTFSNPAASGKASGFSLKIVQDASASGYTVTWPTAVDWSGGSAPALTSTASAVDQFVFYTHDGGTTWYGFLAGRSLS